MKPSPFIFLIGNNLACALVLIALFLVVIDSLQGGQQSPLIITSLFVLAIFSLRANRQVTAYKNFQSEWNAVSRGETGEKQHKAKRKSQIAAAIFVWSVSVYILLKVPRESDPHFYDITLGIFFIPLTSWLCYLLLRAFPGLAISLFKRDTVKSQGHTTKSYIVNHCQSVPKSAAKVEQIGQQLPDYCKSLLERK